MMLNLTPHVVTIKKIDDSFLVLQPDARFGVGGLRLEQTPTSYCCNLFDVKCADPPVLAIKKQDPLVCASLCSGDVLIMSMIAAEAVVRMGLEEVFGRSDLVIASPASGPRDCTRNQDGQILFAHHLVVYSRVREVAITQGEPL